MKLVSRLLIICAAVGLVAAKPAPVPQTFDGMTNAQLSAMLTGFGLTVTQRTSTAGDPFLEVHDPKATLSFGMQPIGCEDAKPCDGLHLFIGNSVSHPTEEFVENLNVKVPYVKYVRSADGLAVIILDHVAIGGITKENLQRSIFAFYDGIIEYAKAMTEQSASAQTPASPTPGFSDNPSDELIATLGKLPGGNAATAFGLPASRIALDMALRHDTTPRP